MTRRQSIPERRPERWLLVDARSRAAMMETAARLPPGSGILLLEALSPSEQRRLRQLARARRLTVVQEARSSAARVHDQHELTRALLRRPGLLLLSPLFETASHPHWRPLPRMRAATLARLAGRNVVALGGMDARRYAALRPLGFIGWAGISAFRT